MAEKRNVGRPPKKRGRPPGSKNKPKQIDGAAAMPAMAPTPVASVAMPLSPLGEAAIVQAFKDLVEAFKSDKAPEAGGNADRVVALHSGDGFLVVVGDENVSEPPVPVVVFGLTASGKLMPFVHEKETRGIIAVPEGLVKELRLEE